MIKTEVKKDISKKSGKDYYFLEIELSPDYKKIVLLDRAEVALIKLTIND